MSTILDDYIEAVNAEHAAALTAKNNVAPEYLARRASRKLKKVRTAIRSLCKAAEEKSCTQ